MDIEQIYRINRTLKSCKYFVDFFNSQLPVINMKHSKSLLILFQIIILFFACKPQSKKEVVNEIQLSKKEQAIDSTLYYFPMEKLLNPAIFIGHDTFMNKWYSEKLFAMNEPIIYLDKSESEIYRFTWLRTFHNPISIRIEKKEDEHSLYWKLCDGAGGYESGKLVQNKQEKIEKKVWTTFSQMVQRINFWELESTENKLGSDGSRWILEAKTKDKYHVVVRWTPSNKSKFYETCDYLIRLTNLEINEEDKY